MANRPMREQAASQQPGVTPASLFLVLILFWIVTQVQLVLVLGLLALLIGTILEGPVHFFETRHFPRPAAILMVYLIIIGGLALLMVAIVPTIADQASGFSEDVPAQLRELRDDWRGSEIGLVSGAGVGVLDRAIETLDGDSDVNVSTDAVQRAIPLLTGITGGLVSLVTLLVITFYYLLEKRLLRGVILDTMTPRFRARVDSLWTEVENKVGGWMRGQLLLCLIIGSLATISYGIIGLSFWPLLGLWAGLTEIVPIIGPWIGGIPAVLVALTMSWEMAAITTGVIVSMQALENWVLVPRVMRGAVGLTPLTVFVAILAGTQFMGVVGAVLAIPIAATIQVVLTDFLARRESRDDRMSARSGWRWMLSRSGLRDPDFDRKFGDAARREDSNRPGEDDSAAEHFVAQEESDSFYMDHGPEPGSDPEPPVSDGPEIGQDVTVAADLDDEPANTATWPAEPVSDPEAEGVASEAGDVTDEDTQTFAAWPRASDRSKPTSSTWPPLEEGRPERLRRTRRDDER
jgi:predicted PurR-regulated permease PerM